MTSLTHKLANSRKTREQIRKRVSELKSTANFTLNEPNLFLRVSSPLNRVKASITKITALQLALSTKQKEY